MESAKLHVAFLRCTLRFVQGSGHLWRGERRAYIRVDERVGVLLQDLQLCPSRGVCGPVTELQLGQQRTKALRTLLLRSFEAQIKRLLHQVLKARIQLAVGLTGQILQKRWGEWKWNSVKKTDPKSPPQVALTQFPGNGRTRTCRGLSTNCKNMHRTGVLSLHRYSYHLWILYISVRGRNVLYLLCILYIHVYTRHKRYIGSRDPSCRPGAWAILIRYSSRNLLMTHARSVSSL